MNLRKRSKNASAPYYWRGMVNRRVYLWSTKTSDLPLARKRAKAYRAASVAKQFHLVDSMKSRSDVPDFAEVFRQYREMPIGVDPKSRGKNIRGMLFVLEASGHGESARLDVLSTALVSRFQAEGQKAGVINVTLNGRLRGARSLFSATAMLHYAPKLSAELVNDFKLVPALPEPKRRPVLPTDEAMASAHRHLPATPEAYRAFLLAAYAGLRAGEVAAARWDWLDGDVLYIGGREFDPKSGDWRAVRIAPDVLALLTAGHKEGDGGPICGPTATFLLVRQLPSMLRALGFTAMFPIHSLRKWYGSHMADRYGIFVAQESLGHSSPAVTAKAYARMLNIPAGIAINPDPASPCSHPAPPSQ